MGSFLGVFSIPLRCALLDRTRVVQHTIADRNLELSRRMGAILPVDSFGVFACGEFWPLVA